MKKYQLMVLVLALILFGKISGFLKDILITYYHGVSDLTDAYFLSGSVSALLYMAVYSSIPIVTIPIYSTFYNQSSREESDTRLTVALFSYLLISAGFTLFVCFYPSLIVDFFAGSASQQVKVFTGEYLPIMSITFVFSSIVAFFNAIQVVRNSVAQSYIVAVVNNIMFCVGLFLFSTATGFRNVLFLGIVSWFVLAVLNYGYTRCFFTIRVPRSFSSLKRNSVLMLLMPALLSLYIEQGNAFLSVYFAARLDPGSVSVLSYANKIIFIIASVFTSLLTTFIFPKISLSSIGEGRDKLPSIVSGYLSQIVVVGFPLVFLLSWYSKEIVELLFQRGSFTINDTKNVSEVFSWIVCGLLFSLMRDVMNRVYFAKGNTTFPLILTAVGMFVNFLLCYIFYTELKLVGLALAIVSSTIFHWFVLLWSTHWSLEGNIISVVSKKIFICALAVFIIIPVVKFEMTPFMDYWILRSVIFVSIYVLLLYFFKIEEVILMLDRVMAFFGALKKFMFYSK